MSPAVARWDRPGTSPGRLRPSTFASLLGNATSSGGDVGSLKTLLWRVLFVQGLCGLWGRFGTGLARWRVPSRPWVQGRACIDTLFERDMT